jgi:hypothetical protein
MASTKGNGFRKRADVELREHYGARVFPLSLPVNPGPGFNQLLDVIRSEVITYAGDKSGKFTEAPAKGELAERVTAMHKQLIEYIAEADDTLMDKVDGERNADGGGTARGTSCRGAETIVRPGVLHVGGK